ncbi:MAG: cytochrome c oxidase accessory protein CcoG [Rhodospirillaceae bacterium]
MTKSALKTQELRSVSNEVETALYEVRRKIYPRAVHGWFASWRAVLVVLTQGMFYGLPWLTWNGRQAVLFDLGARKFYLFGAVFWPQDFIFLTGLLIVSALSLFLFTAVAGRLFCGYACPQTIYTELFMWIERWVEGDRLQRMKLDAQRANVRKLSLKGVKHALWIALALWTGITFVGYFTPMHRLMGELATFTLGPWETFWVLFYGFATYGNAGWMREQVCKYMCPYARFQSVMFDRDTLVISYDAGRGEPRGARARSANARAEGLGDCVNCNICVQVCPTGIDIRDGLQYECIGCGACVDACNQVMDKMAYPRGLIRYSSENALARGEARAWSARSLLRPRVLAYTALIVVVSMALASALYLRTPLKLDVLRDRAALVRDTGDGRIENVYRLQIMNTAEQARDFIVSVRGLPGLELVLKQPVRVAGATTQSVVVAVRADPAVAAVGSHPIVFRVEDVSDASVRTDETSRFLVR